MVICLSILIGQKGWLCSDSQNKYTTQLGKENKQLIKNRLSTEKEKTALQSFVYYEYLLS